MNKPSTSFRLSSDARTLLTEAARAAETTTTAYLERLILRDAGIRRRQQQIEAIALIISRWDDPDAATIAAHLNSGEGWTVDLPSGEPNHWHRFQGVQLTPSELQRALDLATRWGSAH